MTKLDVVAVGNALVDVLAKVDDSFITTHNLAKAGMRLIDAEPAEKLYAAMPPAQETSGGSAANTAAALASLGGKAGFIGKVADDQLGKVFAHDMNAQGVQFANGQSPSTLPTGRCLVAVTPDSERTMNTSLGCSTDFCTADLSAELLQNTRVVYLEGYLFDRPAAKEAFREAGRIARAAGAEVSLTLSDAFCVHNHRADFLALIAQGVDILFANEAEITALYECEFEEAAAKVQAAVKVAVLTRSAEGARIVSKSESISVPAEPAQVVDLTGAGDAFAAGFLFGYTQGLPLREAGRLGALAASEVISHFGARPEVSLKEFVAARKAA